MYQTFKKFPSSLLPATIPVHYTWRGLLWMNMNKKIYTNATTVIPLGELNWTKYMGHGILINIIIQMYLRVFPSFCLQRQQATIQDENKSLNAHTCSIFCFHKDGNLCNKFTNNSYLMWQPRTTAMATSNNKSKTNQKMECRWLVRYRCICKLKWKTNTQINSIEFFW